MCFLAIIIFPTWMYSVKVKFYKARLKLYFLAFSSCPKKRISTEKKFLRSLIRSFQEPIWKFIFTQGAVFASEKVGSLIKSSAGIDYIGHNHETSTYSTKPLSEYGILYYYSLPKYQSIGIFKSRNERVYIEECVNDIHTYKCSQSQPLVGTKWKPFLWLLD